MLVTARLGHQDLVALVSRFDEVVISNIGHHLCTGQDLDMKLLFELMAFLTW